MITLAELLETPTEDEIDELIVDYLDGLGFASLSWQDGSWQKHIVKLGARIGAGVASAVSKVAASGFIRLAPTENWVELVAEEVYGVDREPATNTEGVMLLTSSAGAPSHSIDENIQIADAPTAPANTYRVAPGTSETLSPGGSLEVSVVAEVAGTGANIASGSTLYLWTPLVGVTVTNPTPSGEPSWITTPGTDQETAARLRERARGQWDVLSYSVGEGAYRLWAFEAEPSVTDVRVKADNPQGPGTVEVIVRSVTGPVASPEIEAIRAYIYGETDGVGRRPQNDIVTVRSAVLAGRSFEVTVTLDSAYQSVTDDAAITQVFTDYCANAPIGGYIVPPIALGRLIGSEIVAAIHALPGVVEVDLIEPTMTMDYDEFVSPFVVVTLVLV